MQLPPAYSPAAPAEPAPSIGVARPARPRYLLAATLFLATLFTATVLGGYLLLAMRTDVLVLAPPWLDPVTIRTILGNPVALRLGLQFALAALFILLCHEFGHYLACRRHRLPATLPYFLPAPIGVGTFGAFIRIRGAIRWKRQLLEVGVAGPIAGFVALLPVLALGLAWSEPAAVGMDAGPEFASMLLLVPGESLLTRLLSWAFHGSLPPGTVLNLHPFALAGWVGLVATMLNLLPLGQLDGGHILYAAVGRFQRWVAWPLWALLGLGGVVWPGWWVWFAATLVLGLRHPPVLDEDQPLDRRGRILAAIALGIFILSFMPVPLSERALSF